MLVFRKINRSIMIIILTCWTEILPPALSASVNLDQAGINTFQQSNENGAIFTFFAFLVNGVNVVGVVTPNDRKGEETLRILGRAGERGESRREVRWTSSSPSWNVKWDKCIHWMSKTMNNRNLGDSLKYGAGRGREKWIFCEQNKFHLKAKSFTRIYTDFA